MTVAKSNLIGVVRNGAGSAAFGFRYQPQPLAMYWQDDATFSIVVYDEGGVPVDLTNSALVLTVQQGGEPLCPPFAAKFASLTDAAHGRALFTVALADTKIVAPGEFEYDVILIDSSSKRTHVVPVSSFSVLRTIGTDDSLADLPSPATRTVVIAFNNEASKAEGFIPYGDVTNPDTQLLALANAPVILGAGDLPGSGGVSSLLNGTVTLTYTAPWTGYVVVKIEKRAA